MIIKYKETYVEVVETSDGDPTIYIPSDPDKTDLQDVISLEVDKDIYEAEEVIGEYHNKSLPQGDEEFEGNEYNTPITVVGYSWVPVFKGNFYEPPEGAHFEEYGFYVTSDPNRTNIGDLLTPDIRDDLEDSLIQYKEENSNSRTWLNEYD